MSSFIRSTHATNRSRSRGQLGSRTRCTVTPPSSATPSCPGSECSPIPRVSTSTVTPWRTSPSASLRTWRASPPSITGGYSQERMSTRSLTSGTLPSAGRIVAFRSRQGSDVAMRHDRPVSAPQPLFYFGAMSPYSWFAAERIGALLPQARWQGVLAGAVFKANGRTSWGLTDARERGIADCEARAAAHGLGSIRWPDPWPTSDLTVARAMAYADSQGLLEPYALAAMRLSFLEGADL